MVSPENRRFLVPSLRCCKIIDFQWFGIYKKRSLIYHLGNKCLFNNFLTDSVRVFMLINLSACFFQRKIFILISSLFMKLNALMCVVKVVNYSLNSSTLFLFSSVSSIFFTGGYTY